MRARGFAAVAGIALAAAAITSAAGPAAAAARPADSPPSFVISNHFTQACLEDFYDGFVYAYQPCDLGAVGTFWLERRGGNGDTVIVGLDDQCLDDNRGIDLHTQACNGGLWQDWIATVHGQYVVLQNRATGRCIDDSPKRLLRMLACNYSAYQQWQFTEAG